MIKRLLLALFFALAVPAGYVDAGGVHAAAEAHGVYVVECLDADGNVKWRERIDNVVTTVGKNLALDTYLSGSAYTVTGPFIGLISDTSFTGVHDTDTMASHPGWLEAGNANAPTYSGSRATAAWDAASGGMKFLSSRASFTMTGSGSIVGAFLVFGSGASATIDNTGGTLYSAGTFDGGARGVSNGDTVRVSYAASL